MNINIIVKKWNNLMIISTRRESQTAIVNCFLIDEPKLDLDSDSVSSLQSNVLNEEWRQFCINLTKYNSIINSPSGYHWISR